MTDSPQVSVVMSVRNGAKDLRTSVQSVLSQEGVDLEFIVVNDGSDDASPSMLDEFAAKDSRVRVIHQENSGLTRSLIRGCALARGKYIARQDCGDLSLPGRLREELRTVDASPEASLVSCGAYFVGPRGEPLYDVVISRDEARTGLLTLNQEELRGPAHHGCVMFRRDLYERVGGYREQFYFAQDIDLWTRIAEHGPHITLPALLYQAKFALGSISSLHRKRQIECARIIVECAQLRRAGQSEAPALARASVIRPDGRSARPSDVASALYFVGVCLKKRDDPRANRYFRDALRANPLHLKSAVRLITG